MARFRVRKPADGAEPEHAEEPEEPRRRGIDELLGKGGSEEDYPQLVDELEGIGDIADLLREIGRERRRFGEDLMRLYELRWREDE
jgi:hypothetical protein